MSLQRRSLRTCTTLGRPLFLHVFLRQRSSSPAIHFRVGFTPPSAVTFQPTVKNDLVVYHRAQLNKMIKDTLQSAADAWGMQVKRYEITEITPDAQISEAMDKQAAAERIRR